MTSAVYCGRIALNQTNKNKMAYAAMETRNGVQLKMISADNFFLFFRFLFFALLLLYVT